MTPPSTIAKIAERLEAYSDAHSLTPAKVVAFVVKELRDLPSNIVDRVYEADIHWGPSYYSNDASPSNVWQSAIDAILSEHNADRKGEG